MDGARWGGLSVAIVGGGVSGAALALQLVRTGIERIFIFEPRAVVGRGLAYSTEDPAHRINAPACRMSLYPDDPGHFSRWLARHGEADPQAALPDGRVFPRRTLFGDYVAAALAPWLEAGRVVHVRAAVEALERSGAAWAVSCGGARFQADVAVLATGYAPPVIPPVLRAVANHPGFVANPWQPGALAAISGRVLVVGTGLTMADIVASLQRRDVTRLLALSRRGQAPREHVGRQVPPDEAVEPCATAAGLLRAVRRALARAEETGRPWQSVIDSCRCRAPELWGALPVPERRRFLRHVRPYWESHRYRLAPATATSLRTQTQVGRLTIAAGSLCDVQAGDEPGTISVTWRARGAAAVARDVFDAVILSIGPGRIGEAPAPLLGRLIQQGIVTPDPTGLGLACGAAGQVVGSEAPLFVAGPLTRGVFGEITGVPEIARQAADMARVIAASVAAGSG